MANNGELTPKQKRFIQALLTSRTVHDAAKLAQVGTRTADRWIADPAVKLALAEAQSAALGAVTRQLVDAMTDAIATLEGIHLDGDNPATARVSAARAILDSGLKYAELVDLAERVTELEKRVMAERG